MSKLRFIVPPPQLGMGLTQLAPLARLRPVPVSLLLQAGDEARGESVNISSAIRYNPQIPRVMAFKYVGTHVTIRELGGVISQ